MTSAQTRGHRRRVPCSCLLGTILERKPPRTSALYLDSNAEAMTINSDTVRVLLS